MTALIVSITVVDKLRQHYHFVDVKSNLVSNQSHKLERTSMLTEDIFSSNIKLNIPNRSYSEFFSYFLNTRKSLENTSDV